MSWTRGIRPGLLVTIALVCLGTALGAPASAEEPFCVALSGYSVGGCYFLAFPIYTPSVEWFPPTGSYTYSTWADDISAIASADGQTVYGLIRPASRGVTIARLEFDAAPMNENRTVLFDGLRDYLGTDLAVGRNGTIFVLVWRPVPPAQSLETTLAMISRTGSLERLVPIDQPGGRIAVAADSCTVYYTSGKVIRRMDACTGASLPSFATLDATVNSIAVLSNGEVFATTDTALLHLHKNGVLRRAIPVRAADQSSLQAVAVSPDEQVVGIAAMRSCNWGGEVVMFSAQRGEELWRRTTSSLSVATGLVIGRPAAATIPLFSPMTMLALAAALSVAAVSGIRHQIHR